MKKIIIIAILFIGLNSCTDAGQSKMFGYGKDYKIEMYSGGKLVKTWYSSGKVLSEENSDGYYFQQKITSKIVEVTGDIVITEL
jgi:hypothetical protein